METRRSGVGALLLGVGILILVLPAPAAAPQQPEQSNLPNPADYPAAGPNCRRTVKLSPWIGTPGVEWPKTFQCVLSMHTCEGPKTYKSGVRPAGTGMCADYWRVHDALVNREVCCDACAEAGASCQPCTGDEANKRNPGGNSLGPGDPIYDGMVDGARAAGFAGFGPEHIAIQDHREKDGILKWQIRVDANGCPLPGGDCILWAGENGYLPEGKQEGAKQLLLGAIQFAGNAVRVNGRYVNVETGVIESAAKSDPVPGTDRAAIAQAMADMLGKLGLRCRNARGLIF